MPTVKELIEHLKNNYQPDDHIAYELWSINDIYALAEDQEEDIAFGLSERELEKVMERVHHYFDASVETTWDVLSFHVDKVLREREKNETQTTETERSPGEIS